MNCFSQSWILQTQLHLLVWVPKLYQQHLSTIRIKWDSCNCTFETGLQSWPIRHGIFFTMQVYQSIIFVTKYIIHIDLSQGFDFSGPCETSLILFGGWICGIDCVVDGCSPAPYPSADWFWIILRTIGTQKNILTYCGYWVFVHSCCTYEHLF